MSAADFVNTPPPSSFHRSDRYCFPVSRAAIYQGFDRSRAAITERRARLEALAPIHPHLPTHPTHTHTAKRPSCARRADGPAGCPASLRAWQHNNNSSPCQPGGARAPLPTKVLTKSGGEGEGPRVNSRPVLLPGFR